MYGLLRRAKRFIETKPNPQKLINYVLNKISKSLMYNYALGMPHRFFLEITNSCNLGCLLCPTGSGLLRRNKTKMSFDDFKKIIDKMASYLIEIGIGGFGEPFLNEDIYRMLAHIKERKIFTQIYTNLICIDEQGLEKIADYEVDKLVVSLDAPDTDFYLYYKGTNGFNKAVNNLRSLARIKKERCQKKPLIDLQFIVVKNNIDKIDMMKRLAKDIGVNILSLKTPNLYLGHPERYPDLKSEGHFISEDFNRYRFAGAEILPCPWIWESLIIYTNGDIGPCCYDAQGDYIFGNLFLEDISDIWNNKKYRQFRRNITPDKSNSRLCNTCMERRKGAKIKIEYPINKFGL